jgi:hypothetical protein
MTTKSKYTEITDKESFICNCGKYNKNNKGLFCFRHDKQTPNRMIRTKWRPEKVPACTKGKNHNWKDGPECAICKKCGYDVFEMRYEEGGIDD